jgi:hypothetical protein
MFTRSLGEEGAEGADDAGLVLVLDEEQLAFGDELERAAVDRDDARRLGLADDGAGDGDGLAAREHGLDEDESSVVGFGGRADGLDLDAEGLEPDPAR